MKKSLSDADSELALEVEDLILNQLDRIWEEKHEAKEPVNIVALLSGLGNALLTIAVRAGAYKESFFRLLNEGWEVYTRIAELENQSEEDHDGRLH